MRTLDGLSEKEFEYLLLDAENKYSSRMSRYMLRRSLAVIYDFLEKNNRIFAVFAVLRFAQSHAAGEPDLPLLSTTDEK